MESEERQKPPEKVTLEEFRGLYAKRLEKCFQLDTKVPINLRGQEYILELDNRAAKGVLLDTDFNMLSSSLSVEVLNNPIILGALVYHGLREHHPEITQDEADRLIEFRKFPYIIGRIQHAMELFSPDMSDVTNEEIEKRKEAAMATLNPLTPQTNSGSGIGG